MEIKRLFYFFVLLMITSCQLNQSNTFEIYEKIDGPANLRNAYNGNILFTLNDDVEVQIATPTNNWYFLAVEIDTILNNQLISKGDTIGELNKGVQLKDLSFIENHTTKILFGYTYIDNIKPLSIIEQNLIMGLKNKDYTYTYWESFLNLSKFETQAFELEKFQSYSIYENIAQDPSPGYRIVLFFNNNNLIAFFHSRPFSENPLESFELYNDTHLSFTSSINNTDKEFLINHINNWLKGVD